METSEDFQRIQFWYASNCDGDWEHGNGVAIETIDNPGWSVTINLEGTDLAKAVLTKPDVMIGQKVGQEDWVLCWIENQTFYGIGGPLKLGLIAFEFVKLIDAANTNRSRPSAAP